MHMQWGFVIAVPLINDSYSEFHSLGLQLWMLNTYNSTCPTSRVGGHAECFNMVSDLKIFHKHMTQSYPVFRLWMRSLVLNFDVLFRVVSELMLGKAHVVLQVLCWWPWPDCLLGKNVGMKYLDDFVGAWAKGIRRSCSSMPELNQRSLFFEPVVQCRSLGLRRLRMSHIPRMSACTTRRCS